MSTAEFFHMGGYAFYVWGAFGFTVAALIVNLLQPLMRTHRQENIEVHTLPAGSES